MGLEVQAASFWGCVQRQAKSKTIADSWCILAGFVSTLRWYRRPAGSDASTPRKQGQGLLEFSSAIKSCWEYVGSMEVAPKRGA